MWEYDLSNSPDRVDVNVQYIEKETKGPAAPPRKREKKGGMLLFVNENGSDHLTKTEQ